MAFASGRTDLLTQVRDRRVTVFGLGRFGGGVGVTRFLAARGARVTVADEQPASGLQGSIEQLQGTPVVHWDFEVDPARLRQTELLVINPAVRPDHPVWDIALAAGIPTTSEVELFSAHNRGRVVAVTGSNGKSTTASMIHAVLKFAGHTAWLGGNIGGSLLSDVADIDEDDFVVLELSSFQLSSLSADVLKPEVAVVTGFSPNHLDWHSSLDDYRESKQRLLVAVPATGRVIVPGEFEFDEWPSRGQRWRFGCEMQEVGVSLEEGTVVFRRDDLSEDCVPMWSMPVPGDHNVRNSLAAAATAWSVGVDPVTISSALTGFSGLPFRLQAVGRWQGRVFVNDSNSTTPESTMAALSAFRSPMVLLAGGADKGIDCAEMAGKVAQRVRAACWIGETGPGLEQAAARANPALPQKAYDCLESAFSAAVDVSEPGDIVILSPGCSSFGLYANFERRGEHFNQLVQGMNHTESSDE